MPLHHVVVPDHLDFVTVAPTRLGRSLGVSCRRLHPAAVTALRSRTTTSSRTNCASWSGIFGYFDRRRLSQSCWDRQPKVCSVSVPRPSLLCHDTAKFLNSATTVRPSHPILHSTRSVLPATTATHGPAARGRPQSTSSLRSQTHLSAVVVCIDSVASRVRCSWAGQPGGGNCRSPIVQDKAGTF